MNLIEEIKNTLRMEVRPNSQGLEYLEAVFRKSDVGSLNSLLRKYFGTEIKPHGKEIILPPIIQKLVDSIGGLRPGQFLIYKQENQLVTYTALWPWESNPEKITLKTGVWKIDPTNF
ncbi:MAG: hypothetical protein FJ115_00805 [Deltaproteobacteria bacterium]|nr:hypothetical protein [Deltaproteobacteria bacterium]MBM4322071.1 hypothetical protein [Deltaproteobacteria bacterium]MBM4346516.1 hypothetical protein [Deltaproteobacteria bacterium]